MPFGDVQIPERPQRAQVIPVQRQQAFEHGRGIIGAVGPPIVLGHRQHQLRTLLAPKRGEVVDERVARVPALARQLPEPSMCLRMVGLAPEDLLVGEQSVVRAAGQLGGHPAVIQIAEPLGAPV